MLISAERLDKAAWDDFVAQHGATIFSTSTYLDATAENWFVYWKKDENWGVALPYTVRLGIKTLYQPFFSRYQEVIGDVPAGRSELEEVIKQHFKRSMVNFRREIPEWIPSEIYVYQSYDEQAKISTNAKRQFKKFEKSGYSIEKEAFTPEHLEFITNTLAEKLDFYKGDEVEIIDRLAKNLSGTQQLVSHVVRIAGEIAACILLMDFGQRRIYLKGASSEDLKKLGAMYALLNNAREEAVAQHKIFDFGGSRVDSVKSFNYKLGGVDQKYFAYHYDNSPFWFKLAQSLKAWKKK
ncbi:Acetyltransferase (GNAT) domain-containing protein [Lishizhenia tianjinensis]|uniref:Acetyltransferase (GNAT) domain-containing protein n=1 Tax=Lishizhenia tianjinensis TaxID=477690 RepID=A0A1I6XDK7_9FLAO|nr:GNAT family N-acetyltransferase [Lishizhenia tianjinensis]SFT36390.1 Acetyltransferase (GNAT) domain-containing protein [Lishizhenia tianjinensis]